MNVLFVCNQNMHRSKTAAELFKDSFNTRSAGIYAIKPIAENEVAWADTIVVMEDHQRSEIANRFPGLYLQKRILSLDIPDVFHFNQPELVEMLNDKVRKLF